MSSVRRIASLSVVGAALTLVAFGVVRGTSSAGPARGTRFMVAIDPPVDDAAQTMATHVVRERLDEKGVAEVRVVPAGDKLVVEIGEQDRELVAMQAEIIERTGKLEVHRLDTSSLWLANVGKQTVANGIRVEEGLLVADDRVALAAYVDSLVAREPQLAIPADRIVAYGRVGDARTWRPYLLERAVLLEGAAIQQAEVLDGGVVITVANPSVLASLTVNTPVAVVFDGAVHFIGAPDRITGTHLHMSTGASMVAAIDLVSLVEAGAVHPLHVVRQEPFSRATGFLPRAWPFLAIGAVLMIVALLMARFRL